MSHAEEPERPNPPRRGVKKGLYLIPSAFTAANIGMGFFSVMESLRGFQLLGSAPPNFDFATARTSGLRSTQFKKTGETSSSFGEIRIR